MQIVFTILSLFLSGWFDAKAFNYGHTAFAGRGVKPYDILFSLLCFLAGAVFYIFALWFKREILPIPALVEFLAWLLVAYVGILIANPATLKWPFMDHFAVFLTLASVTFLAYRHGG